MIYRKLLLSVVALLVAILPVTAFTPKKEYTMQVNVTQVVDWGAGAQKFADLRNLALDEVIAAANANARRFFKIG